MIRKLWFFLIALICGCDVDATKNEAANKHEYSVLQSVEYQYRDADNNKPYIVVHKALGTELTVIGFPIKGKSKGYVVMLANAAGKPQVKIMPDMEFVVTREVLAALKKEVGISSALDNAIISKVTD